MTETELRRKVAGAIHGWLGAVKGSETHKEILRIYNGYTPLARGYKVQVSDAWCAATVSAAWIAAGVAPYTGTECSCSALLSLAKARGTWVEDDAHVPAIGDACVYDWQDSGKGDNTGAPDHIGIVTVSGPETFTVTEGNMGSPGRVGTREMRVNGRYIRGFICPDYAAIAAALTAKETVKAAKTKEAQQTTMTGEEIYHALQSYLATQSVPEWAKEEFQRAIDAGITDGSNAMQLIPRYQAAIMAHRAAKPA